MKWTMATLQPIISEDRVHRSQTEISLWCWSFLDITCLCDLIYMFIQVFWLYHIYYQIIKHKMCHNIKINKLLDAIFWSVINILFCCLPEIQCTFSVGGIIYYYSLPVWLDENMATLQRNNNIISKMFIMEMFSKLKKHLKDILRKKS